MILRVDVVTTREQARELAGQYVYVPLTEAIPLPEGEYFVHDIVGLRVLTEEGEPLGEVREVLSTGSNDVYVLRGARGEVLLPATREVIKRIDLEEGQMIVHLLPGLID
jgi:16S rRNA processing protein RimM